MSGLVPWARGNVFAQSPSMLTLYKQPEPAPPVPTASPGSLRDWWREMQQGMAQDNSGLAESAVLGLRQNAEGGIIGALLALIDTDLGGLDLGGRVPLDWVGAAFFYAMSINSSRNPNGLSLDYRAMGQSCTTIAMYRMVHRWRDAKKGIPRNNPQLSGDPVLAAGKSVF